MIIICYNNDAIHNTLNSPMVYDYYLHINRPSDEGPITVLNGDNSETTWPISGQNYMNSTRFDAASPDDPNNNNLGHGPLTVDFNHRIHTTTIWASREEPLTLQGGG